MTKQPKQPRAKKVRAIDDGFTYLILRQFTPNISILFGAPRSVVQLEGEIDAPKTLVYESTLQQRLWSDVKIDLMKLWVCYDLPEHGTIKDMLLVIAQERKQTELPEIKSILDNPNLTDNSPASLQDLFNLAIMLFNDGHDLIAIETIGTLHPEIQGNYSGGTSRFISKEYSQVISICDFTVHALAMREAIKSEQIESAVDIAVQRIDSLLVGISDKNTRSLICRDVALSLLEKASEELVKGVVH